MRLAVTGITSGVGVRLAEVATARGDEVTGLVRDPEKAEAKRVAALGVRLVRGDLEAHDALVALAQGADAVIHLAAHVGDSGTRQELERTNVGGTRAVVEATAKAGVKRFVHMSSVAVYGRPERGRVTEEWPIRMIGTPYEDTKAEAERAAFGLGRERGLAVSAVRPPIIYGPHDRNFMPRAKAALRGKRFLLVDGGRAPLNVVSVDHVVDVTLRSVTHIEAIGESFNVVDEVEHPPPTVREVAETIAREAGLPPPGLTLPYSVAMALGHVVGRVFEVVKPGENPPISPFVVKILTRHVVYDASKAVRLLGFAPQHRALEGIARAARAA